MPPIPKSFDARTSASESDSSTLSRDGRLSSSCDSAMETARTSSSSDVAIDMLESTDDRETPSPTGDANNDAGSMLDVDVDARGESREALCCAVFDREDLPFTHLSDNDRKKIVAAMLTSVIFDAFGRDRLKFRVDGEVVKYWYYKVLRMTLTDVATDALEGRVSQASLRGHVVAQAVLDPPYLVDVRTDIECPLVRALKEG